MFARMFGALFRWGLWMTAVIWIGMASEMVPITLQTEYNEAEYSRLDESLVAVGRPLWQGAAKVSAPAFGAVASLFGIDSERVQRLIINRVPRDGEKYLRFFTSVGLMILLLGIVPWLWRTLTAAFKQK